MAVVVPLVAAFASGAAALGTIAAATTTLGLVAGYASLAGAVLTGVGAITGKKDLMKIGGILSLAGGIGSLANNAMQKAAGEAAAAAADTAFKEAGDEALQEALGNAAEGAAADSAAAIGQEAAVNGSTSEVAKAMTDATADAASTAAGEAASQSMTPLSDSATAAASPVQEAVSQSGVTLADVKGLGELGGTNPLELNALPDLSLGGEGSMSLMDKAKGMWGSLKDGAKGFSSFAKENKELLSLGGQVLDGAFGAEAQAVKLKERQMAQEQFEREQGLRRQNSVVGLNSTLLAQARARARAGTGN